MWKPDPDISDIFRAEKEFGFKAKMDFEEGLKRTIEWYKINY